MATRKLQGSQTMDYTWEIENDNEFLTVEGTLLFDYDPGEAMVRYYPDGTGYPGSPESAELIDLEVTEIAGDGWTFVPRDCPELFTFVGKMLFATADKADLEDQYLWNRNRD